VRRESRALVRVWRSGGGVSGVFLDEFLGGWMGGRGNYRERRVV
jgi:hypothetical protein